MSGILKTIKNLSKAAKNIPSQNQANSTSMINQVILNNGLSLPRVGLGTYGIKDKSTCLKVIDEAISVGYRLFDTGTLYGNDEFIGDVIFNRLNHKDLSREEVFVETKIAPFQHGKQDTQKAVTDSLKRLKLSYLDLVLVHWPGVAKVAPGDPKNKALRQETWQTLEEFVKNGQIKTIGVSNYTEAHLSDLFGYCKIKPAVNQVEFHPLCYQKQLLTFCKDNSVQLQAYSSLGSAQSKPPGWTVLFDNEIVKSTASKHNKTIPQVLLRWGLQHDCLLIPKTSRVENLKPNLNIFDFTLDDEDMGKLDSINQDKHFCWNPKDII